jgi:hypothetical protein
VAVESSVGEIGYGKAPAEVSATNAVHVVAANNLRPGACERAPRVLPVARVVVVGRTRVVTEFDRKRTDEEQGEGESEDQHDTKLGPALD